MFILLTMFKELRKKKTAKKIWIILSIVIIPAFCFWGFGSALRGREESAFAGKVSGRPVSIQDYVKNYQAVRNQYLIQLGGEQLAKLEKYLDLETQAWDRIVLLEETKRKKIRVSDEEIVNLVKQYPFFQRDGKFDPKLYREIVTYEFGISPREFEEQVRDNSKIAKLFQKTTGDIKVSDNEIRDAYSEENEQISLDYVRAGAEEFLEETSVEEREIRDYYEQNQAEFQKPLSYNLEYIKVDVKNKQQIDKVSEMLGEGFSLKDAAKETGLEVKETGFFSADEPIPHIGWSTEILRILPKLKAQKKAWPQPIQTEADSVHFVKLKGEEQPGVAPLDEIKDEVSRKLRREKAGSIAKEKLEACRQKALESGLEKAAEESSLKFGSTELFKRRGYVEGLGDSSVFFDAAANLEENRISQIVDAPSGFYLVKINKRILPDENRFEQEKENFAKRLLAEKKQRYFAELLNGLKDKPNTFFAGRHPAAAF
ncbi:MAG: SurA N-terminal domain-containing protein [Candidatus Omnitrophota bacterium]